MWRDYTLVGFDTPSDRYVAVGTLVAVHKLHMMMLELDRGAAGMCV